MFLFAFYNNLVDNLFFSPISVTIWRREYFCFIHRFFLIFSQIGDSYFSIAFLELFYLDLIAFFSFFTIVFSFFLFIRIKILTFSIEEMSIFSFHVEYINQQQL